MLFFYFINVSIELFFHSYSSLVSGVLFLLSYEKAFILSSAKTYSAHCTRMFCIHAISCWLIAWPILHNALIFVSFPCLLTPVLSVNLFGYNVLLYIHSPSIRPFPEFMSAKDRIRTSNIFFGCISLFVIISMSCILSSQTREFYSSIFMDGIFTESML